MTLKYAVVGHPCKDVAPEQPEGYIWGGGVVYSGLMAAQLGVQVEVTTACELNANLEKLHPNMRWSIYPDDKTTSFENRYDPVTGKRTQWLPVRASDIPENHLQTISKDADLIHLAPMESEFEASYFASLDHPWIVATTQGWMRTANAEGLVHHIPWKDAELMLPHLRAVVFSQEDVKYDIEIPRAYAAAGPVVLYTKGLDGSILFYKGEEIQIGAAPADVGDLTGAGDVIAATFFVYFRETGNPVEAAIHGAVASTMAIEHPGTTGLPTRAELEARLATVPRDVMLPKC